MSSILSKLRGGKNQPPIEPRDIFMALTRREKKYDYPRDVQTEVWKKWYELRNRKNNIIKMNTGSGKTIVGLLILQSCLNEGKGPAVYVLPDKYLVSQVCEEAKHLGIDVTEERDDYKYTENKAILVTTIYSVVNGKSVFGMRESNNYPIGSILIDDVHACLDTIITQFSIKISWTHEAYDKLIAIFEDEWKKYSDSTYNRIVRDKNPNDRFMIPFWAWQEKAKDVGALLSNYNNDNDGNQIINFGLPLIEDTLKTCDCIVTTEGVEIIPEGISINKIKSFIEAERRIFMSATLSDDSVFVSSIGLKPEDITNIITPDNANDIGERLLIFPQHLNSSIKDEEIREKVYEVAKTSNVIVIVPSFEKARDWSKNEDEIVNKESIEESIIALKKGHVGLKIFVNRYDGIDLPDDACRLLVLDGLPPLRTEKDKYLESIDSNSRILKREQIQRIEQGMGRGVRSNNDWCSIILMGDDLANVLLRRNGVDYFSNATRKQYELSKEIWGYLIDENEKPSIAVILKELLPFSFCRAESWVKESREQLSSIKYSNMPNFDENVISLRSAFEYYSIGQTTTAIKIIDDAIHNEEQDSTKGVLMLVKAKYLNLSSPEEAQNVLKMARKLNQAIMQPIDSIG